MTDVEARATCHRCHRPQVRCLCDAVPRVDNRTAVRLYQFHREAQHAFGSVPLLRDALARHDVEIVTGFACPPPASTAGLALLFPSPGARDVATLALTERPEGLVVLDGTWWQAKKMLAASPWLNELPAVSIAPPEPARYLVRREPNAQARSTLEAVAHALLGLEPETEGLEALLSLFTRMNEEQLALRRARPPGPRRRKVRHGPSRTIPDVLAERERLVVVYLEFRREPAPGGGQLREPVYVVAQAIATGSTFVCAVRPTTLALEPRHLEAMELEAADVMNAATPEEFRARWHAFAPPEAIVVAWHRRTLDLFTALLDSEFEAIELKHVVANLERGRPETLDGRATGGDLAPAAVPGRAGRRLRATVEALEGLRAVEPRDRSRPYSTQ